MADTADLARWIIANKDKAGTPEFESKAAEYRALQAGSSPDRATGDAGPQLQWVPQSPWASRSVKRVAPGSGVNVGEMARSIALEGGGAAAGQGAGAFTGPFAPVAIPAFGAIGATIGNLIDQNQRIKEGKQKNYKLGSAIAAGMGGAVPAGAFFKAGKTVAAEGGKVAASSLNKAMVTRMTKEATSNLAAAETQSLIDEGRPLDLKEIAAVTGLTMAGTAMAKRLDDKRVLKAVGDSALNDAARMNTLRELADSGYKWPNSLAFPETQASWLRESLAGKAELMNRFRAEGQVTTNRQAMRLLRRVAPGAKADGGVLTQDWLDEARKAQWAPYEDVRNMAEFAKDAKAKVGRGTARWPNGSVVTEKDGEVLKWLDGAAEVDMAKLKSHRQAAKSYWDAGKTDEWKKARDAADAIEQKIDDYAGQIGIDGLRDRLRAARKNIAQIYALNSAFTAADGSIDAVKMGRLLRDEKLTDEALTIAKFGQLFERDIAQAGRNIRTPNSIGDPIKETLLYRGAHYAAKLTPIPGMATDWAMNKPPLRAKMLDLYGQRQGWKAPGESIQASLARLTGAAAGRKAVVDERPAPAR